MPDRVPLYLIPPDERWWRLGPGWHSENEWCPGECGNPWAHKLFRVQCARCGRGWLHKAPRLGPWLCGELDCHA